jgi:hypothetical protein
MFSSAACFALGIFCFRGQPLRKLKGYFKLGRRMALAAVRARVICLGSEEPLHLTADVAARRSDEYIRFMQLKVEHPTAPLAPSHAVEQVWHSHILDTRSYQQFQSILMPEDGLVQHYPVLSEQLNYAIRYANTLSLLTKLYGDSLDINSWPIGDSDYKLNIMVTSVDDRHIATAGPYVYCHRRQSVAQLVE